MILIIENEYHTLYTLSITGFRKFSLSKDRPFSDEKAQVLQITSEVICSNTILWQLPMSCVYLTITNHYSADQVIELI
jgi:hypothetical protein